MSWLTRRADEFRETYLRWQEASEDVRTAYECWATCGPPQRELAFASYRAALDREEHAAHVHSSRARRGLSPVGRTGESD